MSGRAVAFLIGAFLVAAIFFCLVNLMPLSYFFGIVAVVLFIISYDLPAEPHDEDDE